MSSLGTHLRANAVAYVALFLALGLGSAWAAEKLDKNSVGPKQIKPNAVRASEVKDETLTGGEVVESSLGEVPSAEAAATARDSDLLDGRDSAAFLGAGDRAVDSDRLDGMDSGEYERYGSTLPPGKSLAGMFKVYSHDASASVPYAVENVVSFPRPLATTMPTIAYAPSALSPDSAEDPRCAAIAPGDPPPPGLMCLWITYATGTSGLQAYLLNIGRFGIVAGILPATPPPDEVSIEGVWSLTAPLPTATPAPPMSPAERRRATPAP